MTVSDRSQVILSAASKWKDECLLEGKSIFADGAIWTEANFAALDRYFVQNLDYGEGDFFQKLKAQIEPAPADAKKLAAELLWVMYLVIHKEAMSPATKRLQIKMVWGWSGQSLADEHWALDDVLASGVSNPGPAYHAHRWREYRFFITAMADWVALDSADRQRLLSKPWDFAEWLEATEFAAGRQLRHVLLYLLFPDTFERILTTSHKKEVARAFFAEWDENPDIDYKNLLSIDRGVLVVRERLEQENPDEEVDFYDPKFADVWKPKIIAPPPDGGGRRPQLPPGEDGEAWFKEKFGDVRAWVISAGEGGRLWNEFTENGIAAVRPDDLGDLSEYDSRESLHSDLCDATGQSNPFIDSLALWQFSHEISPGDVLVAKQGRSKLLGYGKVTQGYRHDPARAEYHKHDRSGVD